MYKPKINVTESIIATLFRLSLESLKSHEELQENKICFGSAILNEYVSRKLGWCLRQLSFMQA